jgi:CRISPR system Cascade subunit CasE
MFLSQLLVNRRHRPAQRDLSDRYEMHRSLLAGFPAELPPEERVLFRVERAQRQAYAAIIVQSQTMPDWAAANRLSDPRYLSNVPAMRDVEPRFSEGQRLPFRLQANPTVKRDGKRHAIVAEDELTRWLQRKGEAHGFLADALDVRSAKLGRLHGKGRKQTWHIVQFDGFLQVSDLLLFVSALRKGVGSAKAFGCGLLSVPYSR